MADELLEGAFGSAVGTLTARQTELVTGLTAADGATFLRWFTEFTRSACGATHAVLRERHAGSTGQAHIWTRPAAAKVRDYALPWEALGAGDAVCPKGAALAHPDVELLRTLGVEAFIVLPLGRDPGDGRPLAQLVLLYRNVVGDQVAEHARALVRLLQPRAESELRLRAARDAEVARTRSLSARRLQQLGALAPRLAHDLNNLLCCIQGNSDLIRSELPADSTMREALDDSMTAVTRASALCSQVLRYAHSAPAERAPVELGNVVRDLQGLMQVSVGARARIVVNAAETAAHVHASSSELQQLAMEIVDCAAAGVPKGGGSLRVETGVGYPGGGDPGPLHAYLRVRAVSPGVRGGAGPSLALRDLGVLRRMAAKQGGKVASEDPFEADTIVAVWLPLDAGAEALRAERPAPRAPAAHADGMAQFGGLRGAVSQGLPAQASMIGPRGHATGQRRRRTHTPTPGA